MVCLDSSFIIDLLCGEESTKSLKEEIDKTNEEITIASPAIVELIVGANLSTSSEKEKERINNLLTSLSVLNLDRASATIAGDIEADLIKRGGKIGIVDVMIAAIALYYNETMITKNIKHFSKISSLKIRNY